LTTNIAQAESMINLSENKMLENKKQSNSQETQDFEEEIPLLKDVIMMEICKTEKNWIVIYSFYKSKFGAEFFTKEDILDAYEETSRKSAANAKNFSKNFKNSVKEGYIKSVNNTEYMITKPGKDQARKILRAESTDKSNPQSNSKSGSKKVSKSNGPKNIEPEEFNHLGNEEGKIPSLKEFMQTKKVNNSVHERILAIGYYITHYFKKDEFSEGNIEFVYIALDLTPSPGHLHQLHVNLKNDGDKKWIEKGSDSSHWKISRLGSIEIQTKMPREDTSSN